MELRRRVYGALELAETMADAALRAVLDDLRRSSGRGRPASSWPGRSASWRAAASPRDFRTIDPTSVRVILIDGGTQPLANFGDQLSRAGARMTSRRWASSCSMGLRVVGVDPFGVDTESARRRKGRFECGTMIWAAGVQASPLAGHARRGDGRGDGPGRADRGPAGPQPARAPRGLRRRRHGVHQRAPGRLRGGHAGRAARGQHDQAQAGRQGRPSRSSTGTSAARPRIGRFKSIVSVRGHPPQRVPGLGRVVLRPHRVPERLRQPGQHHAALVPSHGRARPARTRLQRRPHRRRPEPARRGEGEDHAARLSRPSGRTGMGGAGRAGRGGRHTACRGTGTTAPAAPERPEST